MESTLRLLVQHLDDFRRNGVTSLEVNEAGVRVTFGGPKPVRVQPVLAESDRGHQEPQQKLTAEQLSLAHTA